MAYVSVDSYFELRAYTWAFIYLVAIVTDMVLLTCIVSSGIKVLNSIDVCVAYDTRC